MKYNKFKFFLFSEDPDKLVPFYRDILGFTVLNKLEYPEDYGYTIQVSPGYDIWLARHSEVKGYNMEPVRHMLNIYVESVDEIYNVLKERTDVIFLAHPTDMSKFIPNETRFFITVLDPEGNCLQFMGGK